MEGNNTDFGFGGIWGIIMLLIIAGLFSNGGFGFGGNNATNDISNEFLFNQLANDVRANGTAINTVDRDVLTTSCNTEKEILESRYTTQLAFQNMQSQLSSCCCDLKTAIHSEGEETRALITQNRMADLTNQLQLAEIASANAVQTQNLLSNLGHYVPYTSYGTNCGCNGYTNI